MRDPAGDIYQVKCTLTDYLICNMEVIIQGVFCLNFHHFEFLFNIISLGAGGLVSVSIAGRRYREAFFAHNRIGKIAPLTLGR